MWLVQRCKFKGNYQPEQKVSEAFDLDYMGSSEFEWGSVPASLRRLAERPNLVVKPVNHTNAKKHKFTYYILADESEMKQAQEAIADYISGKDGASRLKEHIHFGPQIQESEWGAKSDYGFWWCIDFNRNKMEDPTSLNFCFTFDPEQARCFKLALAASLKFMNKVKKEKVRTA